MSIWTDKIKDIGTSNVPLIIGFLAGLAVGVFLI